MAGHRPGAPPDTKAPYEPERASARAAAHATDFVDVVRGTLRDRPGGLVVAAYDTELLGHWWHEGPGWLAGVLERIAAAPDLRTTTLSSRLARRPPSRRLQLPESSWGYAKGHASWVTEETRPLWVILRDAVALAQRTLAGGRGTRTLRGAIAREIALLHASDWPFMVTRGRSAGYAQDRVAGHAAEVHRLCALLDAEGRDHGDGPAPAPPEHRAGRRGPLPVPDVTALVAALDLGSGA